MSSRTSTGLSSSNWRPRAVAYGVGIAVLAALLSVAVLLVATPASSDHPGFARLAWRLMVLPLTLVLGVLSMAGYEFVRRAGNRTAFRVSLAAANVVLVTIVGYVLPFALMWVFAE